MIRYVKHCNNDNAAQWYFMASVQYIHFCFCFVPNTLYSAEVYIFNCIQQTDKCFKQHTTYGKKSKDIKKVTQLQYVLKMTMVIQLSQ